MSRLQLLSPVTDIKGIQSKRAEQLQELKIYTVLDLLLHLPFRYEDWQDLKPVSRMAIDTYEPYVGKVVHISLEGPQRNIVKAQLEGEQGSVTVIWFNQSFLKKKIHVGHELFVYGKFGFFPTPSLVAQKYVILRSAKQKELVLQIKPIYPATGKLSSNMIEKFIHTAWQALSPDVWLEIFEENERVKQGIWSIYQSIQEVHFPTSLDAAEKAREMLKCYDFYLFFLWLNQQKRESDQGFVHHKSRSLSNQFLKNLPFQLTDDQHKVIQEIEMDMTSTKQMYRLLQGDVGSGKTIVACYMLLRAVESGCQGAFMAPTSILAAQHAEVIHDYLAPLGIKIALLTSQTPKKAKDDMLAAIQSGEVDIVCGTHALFQEGVNFNKLTAIVIDEQHRFGVAQRQQLIEKGGQADILVMTATPIPRTLAHTIYGNLDISTIKHKPRNRQSIQTILMTEQKREDMYAFLRQRLDEGEQAYIVCPLIDAEEAEDHKLQAVVQLADKLQKKELKNYRIGILHGKMSADEKTEVMERFKLQQLDVLVSTTVIEVGVDVPNATIMIIENAERYGLAQLHQLRGRVGRGEKKSYCIMISNSKDTGSFERLYHLVKSSDGFALAEADLKLRGAGELLGIKQHGIPELLIADLVQDKDAMQCARELQRKGVPVIRKNVDQMMVLLNERTKN